MNHEATRQLIADLRGREREIVDLVVYESVCVPNKLASHLRLSKKTTRNYINQILGKAEQHYGERLCWTEFVHCVTKYR